MSSLVFADCYVSYMLLMLPDQVHVYYALRTSLPSHYLVKVTLALACLTTPKNGDVFSKLQYGHV